MTDTEHTDNPVCPHCGHVDLDAWEIDFGGTEGTTEVLCGACGEEYSCSRYVTVYYHTKKIKGKEERNDNA